MRIALAQINATVGDFPGNLRKIREAAGRHPEASLIVFPELSLCGYTPRDLLEEPAFLDASRAALEELRATPDLPPLLVGAPWPAEGRGKPLYNAAVLVRDGAMIPIAKSLLPSYDVFDERRWFRPGDGCGMLRIEGIPVGVTVCEDAWSGDLYERDPVAECADAGARIILNLSASPWEQGKSKTRLAVVAAHARRHGVPFLLCNLVGGNDHLIFDGGSIAVDDQGALCAHLASFREETLLVDLAARAQPPPEADDLGAALRLGISDYFAKTGFSEAIVGMSGGIDSSLVACLAADALGAARVFGIGMPGPFSAPASLEDATTLAKALGIRFKSFSITEGYEVMRGALRTVCGDQPFDTAEENLQARLRGCVLMSLANREGSLVLVPSNKSELAMGYCTLYGDTVGAVAPIADLYKTEVYQLARRFSRVIPARSVERAPSAELRPNQTDQDSLPPYELLDAVLRLHVEERLGWRELVTRGFEPALVRRILRGVSIAEYKRQQGAVVLKLSKKAFGPGRRYPIVERFRGGDE